MIRRKDTLSIKHTFIQIIKSIVYYETIVVREAYDETIIDQPAWEEHVFRCSICGAVS